MKNTEENINILKKLGFTCDFDKNNNLLDRDWYSLGNGWGFRLDSIKNFKHLIKRIQISAKDEAKEELIEKLSNF